MKSLEGRIVELERRVGARLPEIEIHVSFVPGTDGPPCPAPAPYETMTIRIGKPEVPAS